MILRVRGTRDLLPPETELWNHVESTARAVFARYGFGEIRTPIFEDTQLFARGVGEETDIVAKEMYTFTPADDVGRRSLGLDEPLRRDGDRGQSLTLRPENTAGVVRAYIEHKMGEAGTLQKLFYIGPQFRRERPQRGRYRQFWQIGAEVLGPAWSGSEGALRDAEVLEMLATLLDELGVRGWELTMNSVGSADDRRRFSEALREALQPVKGRMCVNCQRRADTNPLRVLDCKEPADQEIINELPRISDFLDDASREHFAQVRSALDAVGVPYHVNPRLVRGIDYYTRTTFEFTVPDGSGLGTQNALLGGGRYDGLSEMLGGPKAPGIGFAIGEDRLILALQAQRESEDADLAAITKVDAFIAPFGVAQNAPALQLAQDLRRAGLRVELGDGVFRLKRSLETADRLADRMVIVGEDEVKSGLFTVKYFSAGAQSRVPREELVAALRLSRPAEPVGVAAGIE